MRKDILDIGDLRVTDRLKIIFMSIAMDQLDLKIVLMIRLSARTSAMRKIILTSVDTALLLC